MCNPTRIQVLMVCYLTIAIGNIAKANNNLFLLGDAFFPTELTSDTLAQLEANNAKPPIFEYSSFGGYSFAFCGFAGYNRAKVPGVDKAFVANLKKVYLRIREYEDRQLVEREEDGKTVQIETNAVRVLFYPRSFEFPRFRIGLRYNENWVDETVKFGHKLQHVRLCCLINDERDRAVMESWRDSFHVEPLEVSLPANKIKPGRAIETPVTIKGHPKAIVLNSQPLGDYFRPKEYTSIFVVDSLGVNELTYEDHEWVAEKIGE